MFSITDEETEVQRDELAGRRRLLLGSGKLAHFAVTRSAVSLSLSDAPGPHSSPGARSEALLSRGRQGSRSAHSHTAYPKEQAHSAPPTHGPAHWFPQMIKPTSTHVSHTSALWNSSATTHLPHSEGRSPFLGKEEVPWRENVPRGS